MMERIELNEKQIIACVQNAADGNRTAIENLYRFAYPKVYSVCLGMMKNEDKALDATQDVFIKAFNKIGSLAAPDKFLSWISSIANNHCLDELRRKNPQVFSAIETQNWEGNTESFEMRLEDSDLSHNPEACIDRAETTRLIDEILDTLSVDQRAAIVMKYYEQMSIGQIANVMGVSVNTVKSRLFQGRKKVEVSILDLERRGTKLYGLAPIPFFVWLLLHTSQTAEASEAVFAGIMAATDIAYATGTATGSSTAAEISGSSAAVSEAGVTATATGKISFKTIAILIAVCIGGGAGGAAVATNVTSDNMYEEAADAGNSLDEVDGSDDADDSDDEQSVFDTEENIMDAEEDKESIVQAKIVGEDDAMGSADEAAATWEVIQKYGISKYNFNYSASGKIYMVFYIDEDSIEDCGDYYSATVRLEYGLEMTLSELQDLEAGDEITLETNSIEGEEETTTFVCCNGIDNPYLDGYDGIYLVEKGTEYPTYFPVEDEQTGKVGFHGEIHDEYIRQIFYKGKLRIKKDALYCENMIGYNCEDEEQYYAENIWQNDGYGYDGGYYSFETVTPENISEVYYGSFNCVGFTDDGYVIILSNRYA